MIWYLLRNKEGQEVRTDDYGRVAYWQGLGYILMSEIDLSDASKCKEGQS